MAEVSVDSVVALEKDELNDDSISKSSAGNEETRSNGRSTDARPRRASAGSMRSSAGKSGSANSSQKVVPRYLRASTGSCHDLCKYGHSSETKEKKPFRKRTGKHLTKLSPDEIPVEILVSGGKKKKEVVASGGRKKEEVVLDVHRKAEKKEEVVSGVQEKEEVVLDGHRKAEKKEEVISGVQEKEEVVLDSHRKAEKKEEVVSGEQKKEELVLGGQKEDEKKEEVVSGGQEKEEVVICGPSVDTKDQSTVHHKPSPDAKSLPTKPKTSLAKEKDTKQKPSKSPNVPSPRNKTNLIKPKLSTLTKTNSSKKNDCAGSKSLLPKIKPSSAKRSPSADPPEIVKSVCFPNTQVEDSGKQGSSTDDKISRTAKKTTSVGKQKSSLVKLKPVKVKPSSPSDDSGGMHGKGGRNSNAETGRKLMTAKACAKKMLAPPTATLSPKLSLKKTAQIDSGKSGNLKLVSPLKDRSRIRRVNNKESNSEKVTEKTLHVIAVETRNSASESIRGSNAITSPQSPLSADSLSHGKNLSSSSQEDNSDSEESSVVIDKATSKNSGSLGTGKEAPVKKSPKKTTIRKNRVVVPEDNKHVSPVKVKFRMGKVMELQTDNNLPRRLRFRRARVIGLEEIRGDSRKRTSKRAAINTDPASAGKTSQKVVLKHQNVQGKKDAQGLLNNVIEETASKLVETRKSKVKALVGAFETVISLQESKPSTQVVS